MISEPSYVLKLGRAKKHLEDLKLEIEAYSKLQPFEFIRILEGETTTWRLHHTSDIPAQISLIAADFVHNVRSSLDHLACALVPPSKMRNPAFPMMWSGVWDEVSGDEDEEVANARKRWKETVKRMHPEAVRVLKSLQPYEGYSPKNGEIHLLRALHNHWNSDKHRALPELVQGLNDFSVKYFLDNGTVHFQEDKDPKGVGDGTIFHPPEGTNRIDISGKLTIAILVDAPDGFIPIEHHLEGIFNFVLYEVVPKLSPYVYKSESEQDLKSYVSADK